MHAEYLHLPRDYSRALGGISWSEAEDALVSEEQTFALAPRVLLFLEGFASCRPLIHFAHIVHFLYLLRKGATVRHDFTKLAQAWEKAGKPARTAGVLAANLCAEVPSLPVPPALDGGMHQLFMLQGGEHDVSIPEEPPFDPETFEAVVAAALVGFSQEDLEHWFRYGQGPLHVSGDRLAEEILALEPRALTHIFEEASQHERLQGAIPYIGRLIGALSVPPRRVEPELPLGGYTDVTTRGQVEQILPGQFALDELEFLRRHAENELLYYRREEPGIRTREEIVLLLDQGVRTWGRVRLALVAAVFALASLSRKRQLTLLLATTGNRGKLIDPRITEPADLAELLAASDLTTTPGLALESLLQKPVDYPRDLFLLTHPRNLASSEVLAAARRLQSGARLFAVEVAAGGEVGFWELRRGLPVRLGKFRLDLEEPEVPERRKEKPFWSGNLEMVGFPFAFGLSSSHERLQFAFDEGGDRLLVGAPPGLLLSLETNGDYYQMLPRPQAQGQLLVDVLEVIGVLGGFVIIGESGQAMVLAYYSFADRHCSVHEVRLGPGSRGDIEWRYLRRQHALAFRVGEEFSWIELSTGRRDRPFPSWLRWKPITPASPRQVLRLPPLEGSSSGEPRSCWFEPFLHFDSAAGELRLGSNSGAWSDPLVPMADGKPALAGLTLTRGEYRGGRLAVLFTRSDYKKQLWLFEGTRGPLIGNMFLPYEFDAFRLSPDGRLLAVQRGASQVQVREVRTGLPIRGVTPVGRFHNNLVVELGDRCLRMSIDRTVHLLIWETGELVARLFIPGQGVTPPSSAPMIRALPGRVPGFLRHDRSRYRMAAWSNLIAVVTQFGEVFLFDHAGTLICGFFAFRYQLAGWMPDGTCLGPPNLLNQPPSPDAHRRMGRALLAAWERGEGTIT